MTKEAKGAGRPRRPKLRGKLEPGVRGEDQPQAPQPARLERGKGDDDWQEAWEEPLEPPPPPGEVPLPEGPDVDQEQAARAEAFEDEEADRDDELEPGS